MNQLNSTQQTCFHWRPKTWTWRHYHLCDVITFKSFSKYFDSKNGWDTLDTFLKIFLIWRIHSFSNRNNYKVQTPPRCSLNSQIHFQFGHFFVNWTLRNTLLELKYEFMTHSKVKSQNTFARSNSATSGIKSQIIIGIIKY